MDSQLISAVNEHLELEFNAYHQYQAMSFWLEHNDLPGFAHWLNEQAVEEQTHARKFIAHLLERDQLPELPAIAKPRTTWDSVLDLVNAVYESERKVTHAIGELYELAEKVGDRPAQVLLQWFVAEQVEEESMAKSILGRIKLVDGSGVGILMIDQELAQGKIGGAEPTAGEAG